MAAEQPIDPYGDGQKEPYPSSSGLFDHHAGSTVVRYVFEAYRRFIWKDQMAAEHAAYSSATIGRGFSADVSARIAHGRLKIYIQADFLSHLFVDRQLSLPVVLGVGTAVNSVWEAHGRQEADDSLCASCSKTSLWKDPALRY